MASEIHFQSLVVSRAEPAAAGIRLFEFRSADGADLRSFDAGAHVKVRTPSGHVRQYSLSNDPRERDRYVIAVKREGDGRGGSRSMVDQVQVGDRLEVGEPENLFALDEHGHGFVLIAGGIGITPVLAMARTLLSREQPFTLYYLTRDAASTAFLDVVTAPGMRGHVVLHHDEGDPDKAYDLWPVLEKPGSLAGRHLYCCGPRGLMDAVRDMTGHWPGSSVHFETFGADTKPRADDRPFVVRLARSGMAFQVPAGQSILDVARTYGVRVASSCESGTCGTCKTSLLAGEADHRDLVLLEEEKAGNIMVCVSRAISDELVLDL